MPKPNKIRKGGRPGRAVLYAQLLAQARELRELFGGLPAPDRAAEIWHGIWIEESHNSTAIEGNTLALAQVETLLDEDRAVGSKALSEYLEVRGYASAASWVYGHAIDPGPWTDGEPIALAELRHLHTLAMTPVWEVAPHPQASEREAPGSFREHDIAAFPGGMRPPPWPEVPALVTDWIAAAAPLAAAVDDPAIVEALASHHAHFERIHPFLDGNGRTGRLALNLILVRLGLPPAIVRKRDRGAYLRALRHADAGDPGQLGELLARAILDNLNRLVLPAVAGPSDLVPLPALAADDLSANALRVAAIRGRLRAVKTSSGAWRSCRAWVDEYRASRHRRLP